MPGQKPNFEAMKQLSADTELDNQLYRDNLHRVKIDMYLDEASGTLYRHDKRLQRFQTVPDDGSFAWTEWVSYQDQD